MELMILRIDRNKDEYCAGFNRHEWLAFDGGCKEFHEFMVFIDREFVLFTPFHDGKEYALTSIDLATAKKVDKKFGFEGSFVRAYKLRTVKE